MSLLVKYVITDPCYILNNDTWDECCKFLDDSPKAFNEAVSKAAIGIIKFMAAILSIKNFALIPVWFAFVG